MDIVDEIHKIEEALRNLAGWRDMVVQHWNVAQQVTLPEISVDKFVDPATCNSIAIAAKNMKSAYSQAIENTSIRQTQEIIANNSAAIPVEASSLIANLLKTQMKTFTAVEHSVKTDSILDLVENFQNANWVSGLNSFVKDISNGYTPAPNVALLRNVTDLGNIVANSYPSSFKPLLKKLQKRSGERLAINDQLEISVQDRLIRPIYNTELTSNIEGLNVIASSTEVLPELSEDELIVFVDLLSNKIELAGESETGKKIYMIIDNWRPRINFDREYYFHARAMKENGCPYTSDEMGKAPNMFVKNGRYNHMKQSHYYFSDSKKGAISEVKRHNPSKEIQTVRIRPKREIQMIDLSGEVPHQNLFLKSLRYKADSEDPAPKEYLLPQYVVTCCKDTGIEGIKYCGGKNYTNYVVWEDGYFNVDLCW